MKLTKRHIIGIIFAIALAAIAVIFFRTEKLFYFIMGVAAAAAILPFIVSVMVEVGREKEKEEMFLEFSRNLVETVKAGTPISKAIINLRNKDYGSLTPHIMKLVNQVALGIPVKQAFDVFASDINNRVVTRSVVLISEAEQSGGSMDTILESVAKSVSEIEDIKKEQKAGVYNLVIQGYIIFFIFIIIMLVTEFKIVPMTTGLGTNQNIDLFGTGKLNPVLSPEQISTPFLILLIVQGLFAGLVIGKLSEGNIKSGIKHSFIFMLMAWLITTGVRALL